MKNLEKLKFEDFKHFNLTISSLKSIVGGGTKTSINIPKDPRDGPDYIDDCDRKTTYADGSTTKSGGDDVK